MNGLAALSRIEGEVGNDENKNNTDNGRSFIMKKTFVSLAALTLALSVCASGAMAAGMGRGANFADADGDGVCDNYAAGARPQDGTGRANGFGGGRGR